MSAGDEFSQGAKPQAQTEAVNGCWRNDANKVLWMEKTINRCFERHNRESRLKEETQRED